MAAENEQHDFAKETPELDFSEEDAALARAMAGPSFDAMWSSPDAAFEFLRDSNPDVRAAALIACADRWKMSDDPVFREILSELVENDTGKPQSLAVTYLAMAFLRTGNRKAQRILARIVRDETASIYLRNDAYRNLRRIEFGFEIDYEWQQCHEFRRIAEDKPISLMEIDWDLIRRIEQD